MGIEPTHQLFTVTIIDEAFRRKSIVDRRLVIDIYERSKNRVFQ
jgi:hypothetical protein